MALCALALALGCTSEPTARLSVPLSGAGAGGTIYVLQGARFRITGPRSQTLNGDDTSGAVISAGLPVGDYQVRLLDGWTLVRLPDGTPMEATLASPNPQDVTITAGVRASVIFVFDVMGETIAMTGDGDIDIGFEVRERDASLPDASLPDAGGCVDGVVCGTDVGACQSGIWFCMGGMGALCMGSVDPTTELCNLLDDDCDGVTDEGMVCVDAGLDGGPGADAGVGADGGVSASANEYIRWTPPPPSPPSGQYMTFPGMGVVQDGVTGLLWEETPSTSLFDHATALMHCEGLVLGGYSDWRLPSRIELESIVDYGRVRPAIDDTIFQVNAGTASNFWTTTPYPLTPGDRFRVDLWLGGTNNSPPSTTHRALCVR